MSKQSEIEKQVGIQHGLSGKYNPKTNIIAATVGGTYHAENRDAYDKGFEIGRKSRQK
jgi:hypothetical protein